MVSSLLMTRLSTTETTRTPSLTTKTCLSLTTTLSLDLLLARLSSRPREWALTSSDMIMELLKKNLSLSGISTLPMDNRSEMSCKYLTMMEKSIPSEHLKLLQTPKPSIRFHTMVKIGKTSSQVLQVTHICTMMPQRSLL